MAKTTGKRAARREKKANLLANQTAQAQVVEIAQQLVLRGLPVIGAYASGEQAAFGFVMPGGEAFSERYVCKLPLAEATVDEVERRYWQVAA